MAEMRNLPRPLHGATDRPSGCSLLAAVVSPRSPSTYLVVALRPPRRARKGPRSGDRHLRLADTPEPPPVETPPEPEETPTPPNEAPQRPEEAPPAAPSETPEMPVEFPVDLPPEIRFSRHPLRMACKRANRTGTKAFYGAW